MRHRLLLLLASPLVALAEPTAAVTMEWVLVGDPGNAPDTAANCSAANCGSVAYPYRISKYEVTNAQYAEFLNAKAASDPLALYNTSMDTDAIAGGITRSGASGSYTYAAKPGFADKAVMYVSFYDALRFANWLSNGQGGGDTESGTYTLLGGMPAPSNGATVARNPGARVFLASEGWGTAAHYLAAAYWVLGSPMQEVDHLGFRVASLVPACDDGADNDRDGLADLADPGCFDGAGSLEDPRCQDGFDNDNHAGIDFDGGASLDLDDDGFIDAAFNPATPEVGDADTQCVGKPSRNSEASCGLGSELALLLPPLMLLRSRRRRRC